MRAYCIAGSQCPVGMEFISCCRSAQVRAMNGGLYGDGSKALKTRGETPEEGEDRKIG